MLTSLEKQAVLATAKNHGIPVWWIPAEFGWARTAELQRIAKRYRRRLWRDQPRWTAFMSGPIIPVTDTAPAGTAPPHEPTES